MEVINDLLNYNNMKIVQRNDGFAFSLDSVLLANFATVNKQVNSIIDLGCGNAPIPLILSTKSDANIIGVDILEESVYLARKSVEINNLSNQITIYHRDLKDIYKEIGNDKFDLVTSNPPYFKVDENSNLNESKLKEIARHEVCIKLEDIIKEAKILLRNGGYFALVHRPTRLIEIIELMRKHNLEPKRLRLVYPKIGEDANLILIEGRKNGNEGLIIEKPLYVHDSNGNYLDEILNAFEVGAKI